MQKFHYLLKANPRMHANLPNFEPKVFAVMSVAQRLDKFGACVICSVRSEKRLESLTALVKGCEVYVCNVENPNEIRRLEEPIGGQQSSIDGVIRSIAFGY
jgi:enoyl-[acyl-carrier-protein] reductase (NADH)